MSDFFPPELKNVFKEFMEVIFAVLKSPMFHMIVWPIVFVIWILIMKYTGLPDDSPIEEAIENIIQMETNEDIDLTPSSPEKKAS